MNSICRVNAYVADVKSKNIKRGSGRVLHVYWAGINGQSIGSAIYYAYLLVVFRLDWLLEQQ